MRNCLQSLWQRLQAVVQTNRMPVAFSLTAASATAGQELVGTFAIAANLAVSSPKHLALG